MEICDLALGVRPRSSRKAISVLGSRLARWLTGRPFEDWTCGFRCWDPALLRRMDVQRVRSRMHGFQIEMLALAVASSARVKEVPVTYWAGRTSANAGVALEALVAVWRARSILCTSGTR